MSVAGRRNPSHAMARYVDRPLPRRPQCKARYRGRASPDREPAMRTHGATALRRRNREWDRAEAERPSPLLPHPPFGDSGGGQCPARRIAGEPYALKAVGLCLFKNPFERRQNIVERRREGLFWRQPIIDGENVAAACCRQCATESIVRLEAACNKSSAMEKDHCRRRSSLRPVQPDRSPGGVDLFDAGDLRTRRAKSQEIGESRAPRLDVQRCDAAALQREHIKKTFSMRIESVGHRGLYSRKSNFSPASL